MNLTFIKYLTIFISGHMFIWTPLFILIWRAHSWILSKHFRYNLDYEFEGTLNISFQLFQEKNQPQCQTKNEIKFRLPKKKNHFICCRKIWQTWASCPCLYYTSKHISFSTFITGTVDRYSRIILYGTSVSWCHTMERG